MPPVAALCFAGQPRAFTHPAVLKGINKNVVAAFGADTVSFFYLTDDDAGSSYGHVPIDSQAHLVRKVMQGVSGTRGEHYFGPFTDRDAWSRAHPVMLRALAAISTEKYNGGGRMMRHANLTSAPRWRIWWETWEKVRRCFAMAEDYEARNGMRCGR